MTGRGPALGGCPGFITRHHALDIPCLLSFPQGFERDMNDPGGPDRPHLQSRRVNFHPKDPRDGGEHSGSSLMG